MSQNPYEPPAPSSNEEPKRESRRLSRWAILCLSGIAGIICSEVVDRLVPYADSDGRPSLALIKLHYAMVVPWLTSLAGVIVGGVGMLVRALR